MQKNTYNSDTVKFQWVRRICSLDDWNKMYARDDKEKYPILSISKERKEIEFAYMAVQPTIDLPATRSDLEKIREFCKSKNLYPRPN